jgi:hypothetical protein
MEIDLSSLEKMIRKASERAISETEKGDRKRERQTNRERDREGQRQT